MDPATIMVVDGCPEPEELIAATRPITAATGKAVTVGKSGNTSEILQVCRKPSKYIEISNIFLSLYQIHIEYYLIPYQA